MVELELEILEPSRFHEEAGIKSKWLVSVLHWFCSLIGAFKFRIYSCWRRWRDTFSWDYSVYRRVSVRSNAWLELRICSTASLKRAWCIPNDCLELIMANYGCKYPTINWWIPLLLTCRAFRFFLPRTKSSDSEPTSDDSNGEDAVLRPLVGEGCGDVPAGGCASIICWMPWSLAPCDFAITFCLEQCPCMHSLYRSRGSDPIISQQGTTNRTMYFFRVLIN